MPLSLLVFFPFISLTYVTFTTLVARAHLYLNFARSGLSSGQGLPHFGFGAPPPRSAVAPIRAREIGRPKIPFGCFCSQLTLSCHTPLLTSPFS
ncbi:hypothetical protein BJ165DRAFT_1498116 [Panaeolus papilionaceus]|nr:hypothetical protein BJ165DRAFT_1498116 [Panaeolus papilionaceus]